MNQVNLIGRLGKDPEHRMSNNGMDITKFSLATDGYGSKDPDWHNIVTFSKTAQLCAQYLSKGSQVRLTGRIQYRKYEKDGETKYFTEIVASEVEFLGGKSDQDSSPSPGRPSAKPKPLEAEVELNQDEIPF